MKIESNLLNSLFSNLLNFFFVANINIYANSNINFQNQVVMKVKISLPPSREKCESRKETERVQFNSLCSIELDRNLSVVYLPSKTKSTK